jgi:hypothetical protein
MQLPDRWEAIPQEQGSYSRGKVHDGLVEGVAIWAEEFNGIYCIGAVGDVTFVLGGADDGDVGFKLYTVTKRGLQRDIHSIHYAKLFSEMNEWIALEGGAILPWDTFKSLGEEAPLPHYAVHTYAVFRIKTIGDSPRPGESMSQFAFRVSDAVAASLGNVELRGIGGIEGSDVVDVEYGEEVSSVLVDEITGGDDDEVTMHWFDDHMEPNDGNGTDSARYARLKEEVTQLRAENVSMSLERTMRLSTEKTNAALLERIAVLEKEISSDS